MVIRAFVAIYPAQIMTLESTGCFS